MCVSVGVLECVCVFLTLIPVLLSWLQVSLLKTNAFARPCRGALSTCRSVRENTGSSGYTALWILQACHTSINNAISSIFCYQCMCLCMLTDLRVGRLRPADILMDTISEVGFPQLETSKRETERRRLIHETWYVYTIKQQATCSGSVVTTTAVTCSYALSSFFFLFQCEILVTKMYNL